MFHCTILLLNARPDGVVSSTISPASDVQAKISTNDVESPAAAVVTTLQEIDASIENDENKKHLSASVAITAPETVQRQLNNKPKPIQSKKIDNNNVKAEVLIPVTITTETERPATISTVAASTTKKRYNQSHVQSVVTRRKSNAKSIISKNVNNHGFAPKTPKHVKNRLKQSNRQYFDNNVYAVNAFLTTPHPPSPPLFSSNQWQFAPILASTVSTVKPLTPILSRPAVQPQIFLSPQEVLALNSASHSQISDILNVDNTFHSHPNHEYQLNRPPPSYSTFTVYEQSTVSPALLHLSKNITKLYSTYGSGTLDPYNNYHKLHTKPTKTRRKTIRLRVSTTKRPNKHNSNNGNNYANENNENVNNNNMNNGITSGNSNNNKNTNNNLHENNQSHQQNSNSFNTNQANYNNNYQSNSNANNQAQNVDGNSTKTTQNCKIMPNPSNPQSESVCNVNDLNIIIKFDGSPAANATKDTSSSLTQVKRRKSTTVRPYYHSSDSFENSEEDDEEEEAEDGSDENDEFSSYFEPFQSVFSFFPANRARKKRPMHGNKDKPHKHKPNEMMNKYQTIILQTPAPVPKPSTKHEHKHSLFYKFLAFLPILTFLKPIGFGIWTLVLSPILVIAIGGIALGVVLYPFLAISKEQVAYASQYRSPKIVIHKHPRPKVVRPKPQPQLFIQNTTPFPIAWPKPVDTKPYTISWTSAPFLQRRENADRGLNRQRKPFRMTSTLRNNEFRYRNVPQRQRMTSFQRRAKRRTRDTNFQQWLLIQNNFNVRIMSYGDNDYYDADVDYFNDENR